MTVKKLNEKMEIVKELKEILKGTKKALAKAKRMINKMNYEQLASKKNIKKVFDEVYEEFKDEELCMQCITLFDKIMVYAEKMKNIKFWEEVQEMKNENKRHI